jgi:hypothetical protein
VTDSWATFPARQSGRRKLFGSGEIEGWALGTRLAIRVPRMSRAVPTIALVALCTGLGSVAQGEAKLSTKTVYGELFGPGGLYSLGYDLLLDQEVAVGVGVSYLSFSDSVGLPPHSVSRQFTIPLTASYLVARAGEHALETGGSATIVIRTGHWSPEPSGIEPWGALFLGYRRQPPRGGVQVRLGLCLLGGMGIGTAARFADEDHSPPGFGVLPLPYVSVGVGF